LKEWFETILEEVQNYSLTQIIPKITTTISDMDSETLLQFKIDRFIEKKAKQIIQLFEDEANKFLPDFAVLADKTKIDF
jgi:hypothetical protein